jgi:hypothetical protein
MRWIATLATLVALAVLGCCAGQAVAAGISWSPAQSIDHVAPFASPQPLVGVGCAGSRLCVAGDGDGIVRSTNPSGGAGSWSSTSFVSFAPGLSVNSVSCPSTAFCAASAAGDSILTGYLVTSEEPTGSPAQWHLSSVPAVITEISCPSSSFCAGVAGNKIELTRDPQAKAPRWVTVGVPTQSEMNGVSCPDAHFCAAVGSGGRVFVSSSPTGGAKTWHASWLPGHGGKVNYYYSDISCPTPRMCAIGTPGWVATATDPAGRHPKWHAVEAQVRENLTCPATGLCVSVDAGGVTTSLDPTGPASAWRTESTGWQQSVPSLACGSTQVCVAIDSADDVMSSAAPVFGGSTWTRFNLAQGFTALDGISCFSGGCVASDAAGNLVSTTDPAGDWQLTPESSTGLGAVSCTTGLCAVTSANGLLVNTGTGWSTTAIPVGESEEAITLSCPTSTMCAVATASGDVITSADPVGGSGTWNSAAIGTPPVCGRYGCTYDDITGISCPTDQMCAATDGSNLWVSTDPLGGLATWQQSSLPKQAGRALTCPSSSICVLASGTTIYTTTDPTDATPQWTSVSLPNVAISIVTDTPSSLGPDISGVSCVSTSLCAAVDSQLGYVFSGDPTDGPWTATKIDFTAPVMPIPPFGLLSLTGISCVPSGQCVAIDGIGDVFIGQAG